jgi:hypothetical protein
MPLGALFLVAGCSAVGWELQNYAFYGETPRADGRRLKPINVVERIERIEGLDTALVREGEFQVDTMRIKGERLWVATRRSADSLGRPLLDSVWLDRYDLHTLRSWTMDGTGRQTRLKFDRRVVKAEIVDPAGRVRKHSLMHSAAPYGRVGIEVVLGALRWQREAKGALPVVSPDGREMSWLEYEVVDQTSEPRQVAGGMVFSNVWVVQVRLDGVQWRYWIDEVEHAVVRRSLPRPDGSRLVVARGRPVPKLALFAVEPLPTRMPAREARNPAEGRLIRAVPPRGDSPPAAEGGRP